MRYLLRLVLLTFIVLHTQIYIYAQSDIDISRISLTSVYSENIDKGGTDFKNYLDSKLNNVLLKHSMGSYNRSSRFIIFSNISVSSKDISSSAPVNIAMTAQISFTIGDAVDGVKYSSILKSAKGVGSTEEKALLNLVKNLNIDNKEFEEFIAKGKSRILDYYNSNCSLLLSRASSLADQQLYDNAIYELMSIPEISSDCYQKALNKAKETFMQKEEYDCTSKLSRAKITWATSPTIQSAKEIAAILGEVNPSAKCYKEVADFLNNIKKKIETKITEDDKRSWYFKLLQERNSTEIEKQRLSTIKEIALAASKNQPTIIYNLKSW